MILTDEERRKFAAWCRQLVLSNKAIIEQMGKLSMTPSLKEQMIKREKIEIVAAEVIAAKLESTETVNVVSSPMPRTEGAGGGA
jgi:hypothetical protein